MNFQNQENGEKNMGGKINHETCLEDFFCSRLGETISISKTYLLHRSSYTKQIDKRCITDPDCDWKKECGVQDPSGKIDWCKCVHPELKDPSS